ncbi:MAG: hypothetical protein CMC23_03145 [Flavobacteriaceae bacterium]|nr:hypothetical protein [Flavobacteriaceae bacterium]
MRRLITLFFLLTNHLIGFSQIHEMGMFLGGSNTISDLGSTHFIYANSPAFGLIYKWNLTTRYALRASFITSKLKSSDYYANDLSRFNRFFEVDNKVFEFSAGMEVNFFDFDLHNQDREFSPYFFTGINYFQYQLFTVRNGLSSIDVNKYDSALEFSIPAIVGIKFSINNSFVLSFETGIRYSLTDNIDGSNPIGQFENDIQVKHGELYNNDWYVFTGIALSYTFGRQPCYCKER